MKPRRLGRRGCRLTLALVERYGSAWDWMVICTSPEIFPRPVNGGRIFGILAA